MLFADKIQFRNCQPFRETPVKALVCEAPHVLALHDRPEPTRPHGWAIVAPSFVGVCGTDFHIYEGLHPFLQYPRVIGHEIAGTILECSPEGRFRAGERVVVNPYISCGDCRACNAGKPNCCVRIRVLGVHTDGAMTQAFAIPEINLYPAGDLSPRDASMVEFLAIGAHAVRRGAVGGGMKVAVVGAGPIGLGVGIFARLAGADVTFADMNTVRLSFARDRLGFSRSLEAGASLLERAEADTQGLLYDVVFDATGKAVSMERGFDLVGAGGSYVFVSIVKDRISFADPLFHAREMTLLASRNATARDFEQVMAAMGAGHVPTDALNTHTAGLETAAEAIPLWLQTPDQVIKAMIKVGA
jgi:2-desacetyl-2-hydroxyethyl bacteriochlorophyllide A dehydrogenase